MPVPTAPSVGVKEVHVSVKKSRDYQAVELSAVVALEPGADNGAALAAIDDLYGLLAEEAEVRIASLSGKEPPAGPIPAGSLVEALGSLGAVPVPSDDDAPPFYDNEGWAQRQPAAPAVGGNDFLIARKPDKSKGPKEFRYLPESRMSKRDLEDASKKLAAERGFPADQLIAFDNRDRLDKPGYGACVVKARRGSALAEKLGDRDTVGYTAWSAEGKLALDVWAKV